MKKFIKTILLSIFLTIAFLNINIYSETDVFECGDLDFDSKNEKIEFISYFDSEIQKNAIKEIIIYEKNSSNKYVKMDTVKFPEHYILNSIDVVDINKKDKQKEVVMELSNMGYTSEVNVFVYQNNKLKNIKKINAQGISANSKPYKIDKSTNNLKVITLSFYPIQHLSYKEYTISKGKIKDVTPNETKVYWVDKKLDMTAIMKVKTYSDSKFSKAGFTIQPNETIEVVSINKIGKYFKVKNSSGKIGYIPLVTKVNTDERNYTGEAEEMYYLRDYKDITVDNIGGNYAFENNNRAG